MGKTYIIAGTGFRGFCDAVELLSVPGNKVIMVDPLPFFGGIAHSMEVKGFYVDRGVHVFDSIPKDLADIVNEIMDGHTRPIDFVSASAFNGHVTDGFSLPDLASLDERLKAQIKMELLELASKDNHDENARNLAEVFINRYGKTAGAIFDRIFEKVYSISAKEIEPSGMAHTSLHRLKFLDDAEMMELKKQNPWLDTVLAARRKTIGKIDDLVSIYPDTGEAMKGWCERAAKWLEAKGAEIYLGEKIIRIKDNPHGVSVTTDKRVIEGNQVIWVNDNAPALASALGFEADTRAYQHGTPMVFITMMTQADKIRDFTYMQSFEIEGLTYRTAAAGLFSNQIREDGISFLTSECPVAMNSERWVNYRTMIDDVWAECKRLGIVKEDAELVDHDTIRIPATFKPNKVGYLQRIQEFQETLPKYTERVLLRDVTPFFRRDIYVDSKNLLNLVA